MKREPPAPLPPREAYRLWAATYGRETAVSALEDRAVRELTPPLAGKSLLDAGCGTGRRLPSPGPGGPSRVVGVDLVPEMLLAARRDAPRPRGARGTRALPLLAAADARALPFPDASFDVVWCRLVLGHLPRLEPAYRELTRVSRPDAHVVVTDFHPEPARAGQARSFRDAAGHVHAIQHHVHLVADHERAAAAVGLRPAARRDLAIGPEVRRFYEEARMLEQYERHRGVPFVLALAFRR